MTAKEIFLQNDDDTKFLLSITKNPAFERSCVYAKQQWLERTDRTTDPILAVNQFLDALRDLPIDEPEGAAMPRSGLHHDIDSPQRTAHIAKKGKSK